MAVGNGNCKEMRPPCSWLVYWSEASGGPGHFTAIAAPTVATTFFSFFLHFLPFDIYIYIYIFFTPWGYHYSNCSHMNTGVVSIGYKCVFYSILGPGLGLLSQLHINVPFLFALFVVYVFSFLHKKYVHLVQRLLLYPDDGGSTGCPPQFPPQDVFAELRRVHSSPTGAHDFKSSLLQPLEDLRGAETSMQLGVS